MEAIFRHRKAKEAHEPSNHPSPHSSTHEREWLPHEPLSSTEGACCCPAQPVVKVVMPATPGRPHTVELLLCGHHYRVSRKSLLAAGAVVLDASGAIVLPRTWLESQELTAAEA
jgi:hypothetical protein